MKKFVFKFQHALLAVAVSLLFACGGGNPNAKGPGVLSTTTGLEYNSEEGFQVAEFRGQPDGPNLVYIEGVELF